jgi:hypothetical protein
MKTYLIYTAEVNGKLATAMIDSIALDQSEPKDFFLPSASDVEYHGDVTVEGAAEHMLPEVMENE